MLNGRYPLIGPCLLPFRHERPDDFGRVRVFLRAVQMLQQCWHVTVKPLNRMNEGLDIHFADPDRHLVDVDADDVRVEREVLQMAGYDMPGEFFHGLIDDLGAAIEFPRAVNAIAYVEMRREPFPFINRRKEA